MNPYLYVGDIDGGKAVLCNHGAYKIGPNPLPDERTGEYVIAVIKRLKLSRDPDNKTRGKRNSAIVKDRKLRLWLENKI